MKREREKKQKNNERMYEYFSNYSTSVDKCNRCNADCAKPRRSCHAYASCFATLSNEGNEITNLYGLMPPQERAERQPEVAMQIFTRVRFASSVNQVLRFRPIYQLVRIRCTKYTRARSAFFEKIFVRSNGYRSKMAPNGFLMRTSHKTE